MKKQLKKDPLPWLFPKTDLKMKLTTVFLVVSLFQVQANSYSQTTKLSLNLENTSIGQIFNKIEEISEFRFMFETGQIDLNRKTSLKVNEKKIADVLPILFEGTDVSYKLRGRQVILTKMGVGVSLPDDPTIDSVSDKNEVLQQQVSGTVTDANDLPLAGANILEKGTTNGTQTDFDGNFSIGLSNEYAVLSVSYVGFATKEISVDGQAEINVILQEDAASLEEVVVVGYGSINKRDITGSVGSVEMDEMRSRPMVGFGQALSGKVSGVQVIQGSGRPGSSSSIQIRGVNSLSAGGSPLIVIDGVQLPGFDLNSINTSDIKSIEVLKDAASASIYGSRGASGVILVTTKSGGGEPALNFNYTSGLQQVIRKIDVMEAAEYAEAAIDAAQNGWIAQGGDPNDPNTIEARGRYKYTWPVALENPETLANTDWQDVVFRAAPTHLLDLSFSGGDEKSNYYVSAGYTNQKGIVITSEYQKYSLNMTAETEIDDWLSVGGMLRSVYDHEEEPYSRIVEWAIQYPAIYPVYGNNGFLGGPLTVDGFENYNAVLFRPNNGHPLYRINDDIQHDSFSGMGNFFVNMEMMEGLDVKTSFSPFFRRGLNSNYRAGDPNLGEAYVGTANYAVDQFRTLSYTWSNLLTYDKEFNDHSFNLLAGYEYNHRDYYWNIAQRRGYDSDILHSLNAGAEVTNADDDAHQTNLISYLSRINYSYLDRYIMAASLRRDGSSRFGPNNKWGNFWSLSGAWRVSDETFLRSSSLISNLKLKASYGVTGNDNFSDYIWMSRINQARAAIGNELVTTYYPANIENLDLGWEGTKQLNIGIDLGFWENRISFEANVYRSVSDDLLLNVPLPGISGFTNVFSNNGEVMNRGLELALQTRNITTDNLTWSTNAVFSLNRGEITKLGRDNASLILGTASAGQMQKINRVGAEPFSFFAYDYDGVYLNQAEIDADPAAPATATPGVGRYKDINGDGVIDEDDRIIVGNPQPDFRWGLTNSFTIGNFDLSVLLEGVVGGEIYDDNAHRSLLYHEGRNYLEAATNRWRSVEDPGDGYHYKLTVDPSGMDLTASDFWLYSQTYLRLRDVTIGFNLPETIITRFGISNARIFFNGVNLLLISKADVYDPENYRSDDATSIVNRGVGGNAYPSSKIYSLGINIDL